LANLVGDTGDTLEEIIAAAERWHPADPAHPALAVFVPAPLRTVPLVRTTSLEAASFVGLAHAGSL
jgi:hypothetical protein